MVLVVGWFSLVIEAFILLKLPPTTNRQQKFLRTKQPINMLLSMLTMLILLLCNIQQQQNDVIVLAAPSSIGGNQFVLNHSPNNNNNNKNYRRESIFVPVNTPSSQQQQNFHPSQLMPQSLPLSPSINNYQTEQQQLINQQQQYQHHQMLMLPLAESLVDRRLLDSTELNPLVLPSCQLPPTWAGKWYQMGTKDPIRFTNTEISERGVCRDRKDDKFLFEHRSTRCLVCMVINERHINVLQYKESASECHISSSAYASMIQDGHSSHEILDNLCSSITGDAQLESLFRLETSPIECPIIGQYTFTYDNCKVIPSSLESCIDKKQLNFKFNACPDVGGSESKSEVLKCYADWTEGSNYYMIGRLEPTTANNNVDRGKFRCFVYEKLPDGQTILMAQSLEETCYGLISASEGPRTMRITAKPPTSRCNFPDYLTGRQAWVSVDNSLIYMFNQNSSNYQVKETREGNVIEEATCIKQVFTPQQVARRQRQIVDNQQLQQQYHSSYHSSHSDTNYDQFLVQATKNCQTLTYCVRFHKRASSLIEIEFFQRSHHNDESCSDIHPATSPTHIITLTSAEQQPCPFDGIYSIEAPMESDLSYNPSDLFVCPRQSFLAAHCDDASLIHIHSKCNIKTTIKNLYCLGSFYWPSHGSLVLLLSDDDRQRYQAIIQQRDNHQLQQAYNHHHHHHHNNNNNIQALSSDTAMLPPQQHMRFPNNDLNQQPSIISTSAVINMSISSITSPYFKIPSRNAAMRVKLIRKSQCVEVSRSQIAGSSSSSSSSSSAPSSAPASSAANNHGQTNHVNLLITIISLYHCLKFLYFCNINERRLGIFDNR